MDDQYAMLAIWYQAVNDRIMAPDFYANTQPSSGNLDINNTLESNSPPILFAPPPDKFIHCLGVATGYESVKTILNIGALDAAGASQSAIKILKEVGKRYLGWVGVALAVHSFYNCMSE